MINNKNSEKEIKLKIRYSCGFCGLKIFRPIKLNEKMICGYVYCSNCGSKMLYIEVVLDD